MFYAIINIVQKEIDINTEVLGIVNGEIVKGTDDSVQKEIDINTEMIGIVNNEIVNVTDECSERNRYQHRSVRNS